MHCRRYLDQLVASLVELFQARVGPGYLPEPDEIAEIRRMVDDYRELGQEVVATKFDQATRRHMVASASDYTAGILLRGAWEPGRGA